LRTGCWEDYLDLYEGSNKRLSKVKFRNFFLHYIFLVWPNQRGRSEGADTTCERDDKCMKMWLGKLREEIVEDI
jgi:hypothetical protein